MWTFLYPGLTEHIKILPLQYLFFLQVEFNLLLSIEAPGDNESKIQFFFNFQFLISILSFHFLFHGA